MKRTVYLFIAVFFLLNPIVGYGKSDIEINAKAALLLEVETGNIIYEKNIEEQLPPASITKLMTYLVTLESIKQGETSLKDRVKISVRAEKEGGATYFLRGNEEVLLSELLEVMMIVSANDAAMAIAEHVAGSVEAFVERMNIRAKELGLTKTIFKNPTGMPQKNGGNRSTAKDLGVLARYIIKSYGEEMIKLTDKKVYSNNLKSFIKENTNGLLKIMEEVDGLKTGFTKEAGYCLVSTMKVSNFNKDKKDFRLVAIVLGANSDEDRIGESKRLLDYGRDGYQYKRIIKKGEEITVVYPWGMEAYPIKLLARDDVWAFGPEKRMIKTRSVNTAQSKFFPVNKGEKLGELQLTLYNNEVMNIALVSNKELKSFPFYVYIKIFLISALGILKNLLFFF